MVCKDISEVHCKTETLHDDTIGDPPLQGLDVANGTNRELPPSTEAMAGTDEETSPGMDAVGRMNPIPSVDNDEKVGGLQRGGEDTDSSSSHHPPYPLSDDSQRNSQLTGGNADGKMVLSSHERGNNALATDQKTEVAARQSPYGSINLLPEEEKGADNGRAEGSTECPRECVFHILNASKNTEQEEWQHEQLECGKEPEEEEQSEEKQPELEQEEPEWEKLEKEAKPVHEELVWDREDQKEKRWEELEQEPGREEAEQEAPTPALNPASPSLSKQNWDLHDEGESISSAEGTGLAPLPQESFSKNQHSGEDELSSIVLKACIGGPNEGTQPPAVIKSESQNLAGGSSMMHSPTWHISEHWGDMSVSDPFSSISLSGQDCEETCQDNRASKGEDGHSDGDGRTVQSFDNGGAISPFCREVTSSGAGNPDSSRTLDPSSGTRNLGSFGPADPHPIAENPAFPSHYDFTPAAPSEFNSAASAAGQSQEDADERSQVSPVGCTDLEKAPVSVQDTSRQTSYLQEAASSEGASVTTSTKSIQTPHGLLTPEKGFNEDPIAQLSISKAFRIPLSRQSLPMDRDEVESTPTAPATMHLESSQAPNMALAPANYLEKVQRHQKPPTRSFVFQGKEMEASIVHTAQQNPLLDESHLSLEVEVPGTGSALNAVPQLPEETVVLASEQHIQPTPPDSDSNSPLAPAPDANQFTYPPAPAPDSPLAPAPDTDQLTYPPAPAPDSPLAPVPDDTQLTHPPAPALGSPLATVPGANQLVYPPSPVPSLPLAPVSDANLTHTLVPAHSSPPAPDATQVIHPLAPAPDANHLVHPLAPVPSLPQAPVLDANQLIHPPAPAPSSPSVPVYDTTQLAHPLAPVPSSPLAPVPDADHLAHSPPLVPSLPLAPAPDATQLAHPLAPAPDADQLARHLAPRPNSPMTPAPDANQLAHPLAPGSPLVPVPDATQSPASEPGSPLAPLADATQLTHPLAPVPDLPSSPLALPADAYQLLQSQSLVPDSNQPPAPAPDIDHPLPSVSNSNPSLNCVSDSIMEPSPHREFSSHYFRMNLNYWPLSTAGLLYQEYSDVALNKAIQSQKRADSLAEDFELSSPSSPRLRRKVLSQQDSYLQRLSVSSNASLWQDIPMIRGSRMLLNMSRDDQKLQEAKFELIMSEASYLRSLNVAVDHFQRSSELQALLTNQERKWLFSRLQEVRDVSASFLFELEEKFEENMFNFNVCDVALRHAPEFRKVYLPYVTNQTYQEQIFQKLVTGNARFQQVLEKLESAAVCQRLSLKSFLILPFQRITRLKLLLQNILKRTPPESDEEVQATQAYDALEKLIKDCNENVQRMKSTEELIYLRQKIDFECKIFPLVSQSRRLVKCGELMALYNTLSTKGKPTTRPIYLHLFNDCLLLSRPREGGRFVVFDHAAFSDVLGEKCEMKLHGPNKNLFRLFLLKNNQGKRVEFLFRTETHSEKLRWISALAPPRGEPDLLENSPQVQCIRTYKARENDELALEKADILMVMQNSNDGWMEGVKLSDGERGWFPSEHVEMISSKHARQMNLKEEQRVKNAKQQVFLENQC
uniref:Rho guanine nucleotide exchange factor 5 n=1 Tax=Chelonoidis abingdonii TaxID=106734 RepID=A0A8C0GPG7_CHEAB